MITLARLATLATRQGNNYTTGCLLDYTFFKKYHNLIAIDLGKQRKLDAGPKAIQQINFRRRCKNVFHYCRSERNSFTFFKGTVKVF